MNVIPTMLITIEAKNKKIKPTGWIISVNDRKNYIARRSPKLSKQSHIIAANIDQAILSKIERGQRKASKEQVLKLAEYFNVDREQLLVAWLSDKIVYELTDEEFADKALKVAESKIEYLKRIEK